MPVHVRLTRDGKIKVKVPGRRREVYDVLFLDRHRRRAFRNLRFVLERLHIKIVGEKTVKRFVDVSYEEDGAIRDHELPVEDKVLYVFFNPTKEIRELCPFLKGNYRMAFMYEGRGVFDLYTLGELSEDEERDIEKLVGHVIKPQYNAAFMIDSALQMKQLEKEGKDEEKSSVVELTPDLNADKGQPETTDKPEEPPMAASRRGRKIANRIRGRAADNKIPNQAEEMLTIGEMKEKIKRFQPEGLKESLAYDRYLQALSSAPEREEEIHKLFYSHIIKGKNFEGFYHQLYMLAPKLLESTFTVTH